MSISEAESEVMQALWANSPLTADEIAAVTSQNNTWTMATVKTLLNRLMAKKAIRAERNGRRYSYWPLLSKDDYLLSEGKGLVDRLFDGQLAPLVSHFSQCKALTEEDIESLKKLIKELD